MLSLRRVPNTRSFDLLAVDARPNNPDMPEQVPWVYYDTQTYLIGGQTSLSFFQAVNADPTLSNMDAAGQIGSPSFFEIHRVFFDPLSVPNAAAVAPAGPGNDIEIMTKTGRGTWTLTLASKSYGPFPLTFFGRSGGADARVGASLTAPAQFQFGSMGDNGGFPFDGQILLPPSQGFKVTLNWTAASAISVATPVRISLLGYLYRRVA